MNRYNQIPNLTRDSMWETQENIMHKRAKKSALSLQVITKLERQLQQNLNKIENWAASNGLKFSKSKAQCVHFCQLRKQHDDPVLHLYGSPIPVVEESKFLGILFDRKLSFIPHIKYLKA